MHNLPRVLDQLDDTSDLADCQCFLRPSFGRRGGRHRAEFGEFDLILATLQGVYPAESKWLRSATGSCVVQLENKQVLRHQVFRWLRERWKPQVRWHDFVAEHADAFARDFNGKPLAPASSDLAQNIKWILDHLAAYPPIRFDVLIVFQRTQREVHVAHPFRVVQLPFMPIGPGLFFKL
jgi:hypothetical protein